MDKLKQTFSRNKDGQEVADTTGSTGKVSGQGSHFSSSKAMDNSTLGSSATGQQDQGIGGTSTDPTAARGTAGPEAGAGSHVNTISADSAPQSTATAAAGQTTTYSTHHLGKGDPTPSVVDTQSSDPTTYQRPEAGASTGTTGASTGTAGTSSGIGGTSSGIGSASSGIGGASTATTGASTGTAGVPSGSAETAARKAFTGGEGMPGAYPDNEYKNPYLAENLDPRVDGLPIRSKDTTRDTTRSSALPATAAAGAGLGSGAALAAAQKSSHDAERTTPATSGLTSTANPSDRSADYSQSERTRVPETGAASTTTQDEPQQSSGFVGKALAAVGLGGAGAAAGYGLANRGEKDSAVSDVPATGGQVGHTRKESIPTTAYPGGDRSPAPINAPVGGTREASTGGTTGPVLEQNDRHVGRDATLGAATGAAAGGLISSQTHRDASAADTTLGHDNTSKLRDDLAGQPTGIAPHAKAAATSPEDSTSRTAPAATGVGSTAPTTSGATSNEPWSSRPEEDHSKRNAALAGAGVGALGAGGAYAATRDRGTEQQPFGHTAIHGPDTTPSTHPQTTSTQAGTTGLGQSAVDRRDDPTTRDDKDHTARNAALAGGAVGAGAVGAGAGASIIEQNKRAQEEAARQREAAEKAHKDAAKQAEKDEKKHQKEVEKAEKHHEKEVAKAQKQHEKEEAARDKEIEKTRTKEREEEEERRRKAAAAAAVGGAGAAGAGAYAYDKSRDDTAASPGSKAEEKEKKPGLFKRIFKRRKNKDTGEDEEYESDEEVKDDHHKGAYAGAAAGTAAAGAGAYGIHEARKGDNDTSNIGTAHTTDSATTEPKSTYEAASGGAVKPSYNPFTKDDPSKTTDTTTAGSATEVKDDHHKGAYTGAAAGTAAAGAGAYGIHEARKDNNNNETGLLGTTSSDARPSEVTTNPTAARMAESHMKDPEKKDLPIEPTLGIPYDPSKDPEAARRLDEASELRMREENEGITPGVGGVAGTGTAAAAGTAGTAAATEHGTHGQHGTQGTSSSLDRERSFDDDNDPTSPGGTKKGFRQKLKEAITGHKEEEEKPEQHSAEHGVLHKKPHQVPEEVRGSGEAGRTTGGLGGSGSGSGSLTSPTEPEDEFGRGKKII